MSKKDMLGPLTRVLVGVPKKMLGLILNIANRLGSADGESFYNDLKKFVREWKKLIVATEAAEEVKIYLRRLYETETITVGATDGTETLHGLSASGHATEAATVVVDEQVADGTFARLFESKGKNRRRWSLSQVAKFSRENPDRLRGEGYGNFFELEDGSVANVFVRGVQPFAFLDKFSVDHVWLAEGVPRVFSLQ